MPHDFWVTHSVSQHLKKKKKKGNEATGLPVQNPSGVKELLYATIPPCPDTNLLHLCLIFYPQAVAVLLILIEYELSSGLQPLNNSVIEVDSH